MDCVLERNSEKNRYQYLPSPFVPIKKVWINITRNVGKEKRIYWNLSLASGNESGWPFHLEYLHLHRNSKLHHLTYLHKLTYPWPHHISIKPVNTARSNNNPHQIVQNGRSSFWRGPFWGDFANTLSKHDGDRCNLKTQMFNKSRDNHECPDIPPKIHRRIGMHFIIIFLQDNGKVLKYLTPLTAARSELIKFHLRISSTMHNFDVGTCRLIYFNFLLHISLS